MSKVCNVNAPINSVNGITINRTKPCHSSNYKNLESRNVEYLVFHYTGNTKDTASANANYFMGANRQASAHYFVDDNSIWQSVDVNDQAIHCGTWGTYYHDACRNQNSIGIEMCCTAGNYKIGAKALENAAQLGAALCKYLGITDVDKYVVRHYDVTHKKCPAQMSGANNKEWAAFKARIKEILNPVVANSNLKFNVGDIVSFTGNKHYKSSNSTFGTKCAPGQAEVTFKVSGAKHPYHLVKIDGGKSTVYGWVDEKYVSSVSAPATPAKKSVSEIAKEVLNGKWGNGSERKTRLEAAGYNYAEIQKAVNAIASGKTVAPTKTIEQVAKEVLQGKWGNGADRKKKLEAAGYDYNAVQKKVNELL